ncbi:MAG: hypothetical protein JWP78_3581 [Mucilaginibacter sp.]|nr:hypothetical protein [Mucilaginibacter sp.]
MKKFSSVCLLCILCCYTFAQKVNTDSLTYQLQRAKINQMLDLRKQKFGWYDQSLTRHTGIFGLQTKKDIRRSNEILMDIVKTDDDLFKEIKILMDYRIFEQQQVQSHSMETENVSLGFMNTINRLRQQIDQLKQEAQKEKEHQVSILRIFIMLFVLMLGSILYLLLKKRAVKV